MSLARWYGGRRRPLSCVHFFSAQLRQPPAGLEARVSNLEPVRRGCEERGCDIVNTPRKCRPLFSRQPPQPRATSCYRCHFSNLAPSSLLKVRGCEAARECVRCSSHTHTTRASLSPACIRTNHAAVRECFSC